MVTRTKTPKAPRLCKNNDGKKHYSKGYCQACYMAFYRKGGIEAGPENENRPEVVLGDNPTVEELDEMAADAAKEPNELLAVRNKDTDTDGIRKMRQKLASLLYLARREVVRGMLYDGLEPWQIKNEFLTREALYKQFMLPLRDPDRTLEEDIESIQKSGRLRPLERHIDNLKRSLRRANTLADNEDLPARERSTWAKNADDLARNLAIQEGAIMVVPGKGDMPVRDSDEEYEEDEDDDEYSTGPKRYVLPDVDNPKNYEEWVDDEEDTDSESEPTTDEAGE